MIQKYFKLMENQIFMMQTFVHDLVDLRQLKDGAFSLIKSVFRPNKVLEETCSILEPSAESKGIELTYEGASLDNHNRSTKTSLPLLVGDSRRF